MGLAIGSGEEEAQGNALVQQRRNQSAMRWQRIRWTGCCECGTRCGTAGLTRTLAAGEATWPLGTLPESEAKGGPSQICHRQLTTPIFCFFRVFSIICLTFVG